jgi:hypothetical protein
MACRGLNQPSLRLLLCFALATAQSALAAAPGRNGGMAAGFQSAPKVIDVALGSAGVLRGQVATREGRPAAGTPIVLFKADKPVARTEADQIGHFEFNNLSGGVYVMATPGGGQLCRAWAPGTAPPAAVPRALLVLDNAVIRGQTFCPTSLYEWFETHPVLGYTAVTAAIALPIILINMDDDSAS